MIKILLSFILACTVIELTPGPNMTYLAAISSIHGRRAGFSLVAGISSGLLLIGLAATFGAATIISESPLLYQILRWIGTLYMLWLAWENWHETDDTLAQPNGFDPRLFRRGLITNILNPKAAIFYITVVPSFLNAQKPVLTQSLILTLIYVVIATCVHLSIALLADRARTLLNNKQKIKRIRQFFSALLILIAIWFAWSTHVH